MRLWSIAAASIAIASACTSFSSSSAPEATTPDAEAPAPPSDAAGGDSRDAAFAVPDAEGGSPCAPPAKHVFCADFEAWSPADAAPFDGELFDDAGTTLDVDHDDWTSPATSLAATVRPLDGGSGFAILERKFDASGAAIDLSFELMLVATNAADAGENDVIVATLSVGAPKYDFTIRLQGEQLFVSELPPGGGATTPHRAEADDLDGVTGFVEVHLGVDAKNGTLGFDVGTNKLLSGAKLAAPISSTGALPLILSIGVTATPPLSAVVSYRIDDVTIDTQ